MIASQQREPEQFWHLCILTMILVVAACARIYSLDQTSLSSNELRNLSFCDIPGWLDMVSQFDAQTGTPPLYPTLLCQMIDITGKSDFFVRLLSVAAGIVSIYVVYLIGRDFLSATSGLIAAAIISTSYHNIIVDRTATIYPLLTMALLLHHYFGSRLLLLHGSTSTAQLLTFTHKNTNLDFSLRWRPMANCDAYDLIGFWITGALAFYTSSTSLTLFLYEVIVCLILCFTYSFSATERKAVSKIMWLPLLLLALPWLPVLAGRLKWVLDGNLFALSSLDSLQQRLVPLLPPDMMIQVSLLTLTLLFILYVAYCTLYSKHSQVGNHYLAYAGIMIVLIVMCTWLTSGATHLALFCYSNILILMLVTPIGLLINKFLSQKMIPLVTLLTAGIVMVYQIHANVLHKLYINEGDANFRLAAEIISHDTEFMDSSRTVYLSDNIFKHYLEAYQINKTNLNEINRSDGLSNIYHPDTKSIFYYLEYSPGDMNHDTISAGLKSLLSQYKPLCETTLPWLQVIKFANVPSSSEPAPRDCQDYIPVVKLQ